MLIEIYIENFILVDKLKMELSPRLNVLSGETGAGKSIIIDALGLILGGRIKNDYIKDGNRKVLAEAVFDLSRCPAARLFLLENGWMDEDESFLTISRELKPNGRNLARINGYTVPVGKVKDLAGLLVDMHLQHDNLQLLKPESYLAYIDGFNPECGSLTEHVQTLYEEYQKKQHEFQLLSAAEKDKRQRLEYLKFQINEIENARLTVSEEEELESLRNRIHNAQALMLGSNNIYQWLYGSDQGNNVYELLSKVIAETRRLNSENFFAAIDSQLSDICYMIQDLSVQVGEFRDSLDFEPDLLEQVEERWHEINRLKKKYGMQVFDILKYLDKCRSEADQLEHSDQYLVALNSQLARLSEEYVLFAEKLSQERQSAAKLLQEQVKNELKELQMPHVRFTVALSRRWEFGPRGMDEAEFLFSPNPGEKLLPLSKTASGGEISRFVLALKKALSNIYPVPTLIFDEIDAGVGGNALNAMAEKIAQIAQLHQVILVTHAWPIASKADCHYLIEKHIEAGQTITVLRQLDGDERVKEIARMIGGDNYLPGTLEQVRKLLQTDSAASVQ